MWLNKDNEDADGEWLLSETWILRSVPVSCEGGGSSAMVFFAFIAGVVAVFGCRAWGGGFLCSEVGRGGSRDNYLRMRREMSRCRFVS